MSMDPLDYDSNAWKSLLIVSSSMDDRVQLSKNCNDIELSVKTSEEERVANITPETGSSPEKEIKYKLRPRTIQIRREIGKMRSCKIEPKPKPPPLSKYRRRTANARERYRLEKMNQAFEQLRQVIPHFPNRTDTSNFKLTKITTLRLAMNYIAALSDILRKTDSEQTQCTRNEPHHSVNTLVSNLDFTNIGLAVEDLDLMLDSDETVVNYTGDFVFS
ncbi:uncharacterized protein LOC143238244 [Tachypleus tridentatus]|uniref:uncharacterized protein LOC143238244 n=1 Tax=Tachypleus tridentatus TaxID=6853 RepID=UPI003FD450DA